MRPIKREGKSRPAILPLCWQSTRVGRKERWRGDCVTLNKVQLFQSCSCRSLARFLLDWCCLAGVCVVLCVSLGINLSRHFNECSSREFLFLSFFLFTWFFHFRLRQTIFVIFSNEELGERRLNLSIIIVWNEVRLDEFFQEAFLPHRQSCRGYFQQKLNYKRFHSLEKMTKERIFY